MYSPQLNYWLRFRLFGYVALTLLPFGVVYALVLNRGWDQIGALFSFLVPGVLGAVVVWSLMERRLLSTTILEVKKPEETAAASKPTIAVLDSSAQAVARPSAHGSGTWAYGHATQAH